jgi:hypothetical protein
MSLVSGVAGYFAPEASNHNICSSGKLGTLKTHSFIGLPCILLNNLKFYERRKLFFLIENV